MRNVVRVLSCFTFIGCSGGFLIGLLELFLGESSEKIQGLLVMSACIVTSMLAGAAYVLTEIADAVAPRIDNTKKQDQSILKTS